MLTPGTPTRPIRLAAALRFLVLLLLLCPIATGQAEQAPAQGEEESPIDAKRIEARITEVEALEGLEDEARTQILDRFKRALAELNKAADHAAKTATYKDLIETATARTQAIRKELAAPVPAPPELPAGETLEQIEQRLGTRNSERVSKGNQLDSLEATITDLQGRAKAAAAEKEQAAKKLEAVTAELGGGPRAGETELVTESRRIALRAQNLALRGQIEMLDQDILSLPQRLALRQAEEDQLTRELETIDAEVSAAEEIAAAARTRAAEADEQEARRAKRAAKGKHPSVESLAAANLALTEEKTGVTENQKPAAKLAKRTAEQSKRIEDKLGRFEAQGPTQGFTASRGRQLRSQRKQLRELLRESRREADRWRKNQSQADNREFVLYLEDGDLDDRETWVQDWLTESLAQPDVPPLDDPDERGTVENELRDLAKKRAEQLASLIDDNRKFHATLREIATEQTNLEKSISKLGALLDEQLLWTPSTTPPTPETVRNLVTGAQLLLAGKQISQAPGVLGASLAEQWLLATVAGLVLLGLLLVQGRARQRLKAIATEIRKIETDRFGLTLEALGLVVMLAMLWPAIAGFLGWQLTTAEATRPLGNGLVYASAIGFVLGLLRILVKPQGVGELHLKWKSSATALVRRHLLWAKWPFLACVLVVTVCDRWPEASRQSVNDVGRSAFVLGMVIAAVFLHRVISPAGGLIAPILARRTQGWVARLRWFWYPVTFGIPLVLAGLAIAGYYYTALQLDTSVAGTMYVVLAVILLRSLGMRWILIEARRIAIEQARKQREAAAAAAADGGGATSEDPRASDELEIDLLAVNQQSRQLIDNASAAALIVGVWVIWAGVLPALGFLDGIPVPFLSGDETVTLQDVAIAIVALLITVTAARNLPGVLQVVVLKNLPLDAGFRYALVTVVRYVITAIGIVVAFNIIGIDWASVQWLVAALSVGIGFGLQEIIANFVCGLILLFERPIRIGDIVTVGDTAGTVTRIRIRATTITNWDRKELVIPNKDLITGNVINWTLTNTLNRVVINVGVAYGSDIHLAHRTLLAVAHRHPRVLDDPGPIATFEEFGDSTLQLVLRCYLADFDARLQTIHELHSAVNDAFARAGLEIAFPQLDLHLRSSTPTIKLDNAPGDTARARESSVGDSA